MVRISRWLSRADSGAQGFAALVIVLVATLVFSARGKGAERASFRAFAQSASTATGRSDSAREREDDGLRPATRRATNFLVALPVDQRLGVASDRDAGFRARPRAFLTALRPACAADSSRLTASFLFQGAAEVCVTLEMRPGI
jgi:hypothetical protein